MSNFSVNRKGLSVTAIIVIIAIIAIVVMSAGSFVVSLLADWLPSYFPMPPGTRITGSGTLVTREMAFSGFRVVEIGSTFEVEITRADSYYVSVTADDNLFDYVDISKMGDTLVLDLKQGYSYSSITVRARIKMPELNELILSGATRAYVEDFGSSNRLIVSLSGASSLDMEDMSVGGLEIGVSGASIARGDVVSSGDVKLTLSGASRSELSGRGRNLVLSVSGASDAKLSRFSVHDAYVKLSGVSNASIDLDGRLDANLSGGSGLTYSGTATLGEIEISSGSTIKRG